MPMHDKLDRLDARTPRLSLAMAGRHPVPSIMLWAGAFME